MKVSEEVSRIIGESLAEMAYVDFEGTPEDVVASAMAVVEGLKEKTERYLDGDHCKRHLASEALESPSAVRETDLYKAFAKRCEIRFVIECRNLCLRNATRPAAINSLRAFGNTLGIGDIVRTNVTVYEIDSGAGTYNIQANLHSETSSMKFSTSGSLSDEVPVYAAPTTLINPYDGLLAAGRVNPGMSRDEVMRRVNPTDFFAQMYGAGGGIMGGRAPAFTTEDLRAQAVRTAADLAARPAMERYVDRYAGELRLDRNPTLQTATARWVDMPPDRTPILTAARDAAVAGMVTGLLAEEATAITRQDETELHAGETAGDFDGDTF